MAAALGLLWLALVSVKQWFESALELALALVKLLLAQGLGWQLVQELVLARH